MGPWWGTFLTIRYGLFAQEILSPAPQVAVGEIGFATNDDIMATHLQNDDPDTSTSRASICAGESAESADPWQR